MRHVDSEAAFEFIEGAEQLSKSHNEATPFGFPGLDLGPDQRGGTSFGKVLEAYDLADPALTGIDRVIAAGVRHAFGKPPDPNETEEETFLGSAFDILGKGLGLAFDDYDHIKSATGMYDGLYALFRSRLESKG